MGRVVADMSVSLDGFVAGPHDEMKHVFSWYGRPQPTPPDAATIAGAAGLGLGVIVYGRRTFDVAGGWGGTHPTGAPVLVVTHHLPDGWPHEGSSVGFCTDGVELAMELAHRMAGPRDVALGSPSIIQQCLNLGLVDRIQVKVVPVLLGEGIRLFDNLAAAPIELSNPEIVEGNGVTHLHYEVSRSPR
ncbi:MAG: dihydrofolate reductase family protein [Candidatus Dormibacteria bacterium]|jgi:dihydrofolate reductase